MTTRTNNSRLNWGRRPRSFGVVCCLALVGCGAPGRAGPLPEGVRELADKYSLAVVLERPALPARTSFGVIDGRGATRDELAGYLPVFLAEWNLYPPELVGRTGLKRVVLCKGLSFEGQLRNAVPDFVDDTLYLEVVRGRESDRYLRKVIHHEFFHVIDRRDDGLLYEDERWSALNPRDFHYGTGGRNAQDDPTVSLPLDDRPGFLNRYATTAVEEDKAEVFAHMIVEPKQTAERAARDPVLRAKMVRMRELVQKFSPKVDNAFWEKVGKVERP